MFMVPPEPIWLNWSPRFCYVASAVIGAWAVVTLIDVVI